MTPKYLMVPQWVVDMIDEVIEEQNPLRAAIKRGVKRVEALEKAAAAIRR